ncbi:MAG: two-component regulator propeller domain-containing protein [Sediminibacterium sp.]
MPLRLSSLLLLFLCFAASSTAQENYTFTHLNTDDGLSSNDVRCLYQDYKGFMWIGTANGLQRFDGTKFIMFSMDNKKGSDPLPVSMLEYIVPGKNGTLWLYFPELREVGVFDPAKFLYKKIAIKPSTPLPARINARLWNDSKNNIYLSIQPTGILQYDEKEQAFTASTPFRIPKNWSVGIASAEDKKNGLIWLSCSNDGLAAYDQKTGETYTRLYNPKNIPLLNNWRVQEGLTNIFIDRQHRYWLFNWPVWGGGAEMLHLLDSTGRYYLKDTVGLSFTRGKYRELRHILDFPKTGIWLSGLNTLYSYNRNLKQFNYYKNDPLSSIAIHYQIAHHVLEDKEGGIWVATDEGIYFTSPGTNGNGVQNMIFSEEKKSREFTDIIELSNGDYWLTNWGDGVITMDKNFRPKSYSIFKNFPSKWILPQIKGVKLTWCMHEEKATRDVWIGSNGGLITRFNPYTNKTQFYNPPEFQEATVRYITEDKKGRIWFCTQRGRVIRFENNVFTVIKDFGTAVIPKIFLDKEGWVWVAVQGTGLFAIEQESGRILQQYVKGNADNSLFSAMGHDIDELNDSTIAYGAGALNLINKRTGKVRIIDYAHGLPSNSVQRIRIDKSGYLWIVTNNGLCRYNPFNDNITPYNKRDGVVLGEKTTAADYLCSEGYVMFAGSNSLMFFHPESFATNQQPPDVSITDFKLNNAFLPIDSVTAQSALKVDYDQNSFSIYFSSLSFVNRDKLIYYYKMDGVNNQWTKADRQNLVNFSLLPPGHYTFKVYCENIDGIRSKNITRFSIYIRPPFWRRWWFLSIVALALGGLLYFIHRLRINKILAVENLRNRVARDLHDDMGSTLSTINILSTMAKSKLNTDNVRASEYLGKISDNSQRMMEAMDDIVWSIKPMNDSMQKITARMREIATSVLEAKDIDLLFHTDPSIDEIKLNMEARRDFFLLFKEAINNIAKYSKASLATVHLTVHHKRLLMIIKDNGIGFDIEQADGNGLGNMYKRAASLKGRIQIQSKLNEGTQITLNIPVQ